MCVCVLQMCYVTPDYDTLAGVRERLEEIAPHLTRYDDMEAANFFKLAEKLAKVCTLQCSSPTPPDNIS